MQKLQCPTMAFWVAVGLALAPGIPAAFSAPVPLPREGSCPLAYYGSDGYCVLNRGTSESREAFQKVGATCPLGWYSSGNYCVRSR